MNDKAAFSFVCICVDHPFNAVTLEEVVIENIESVLDLISAEYRGGFKHLAVLRVCEEVGALVRVKRGELVLPEMWNETRRASRGLGG